MEVWSEAFQCTNWLTFLHLYLPLLRSAVTQPQLLQVLTTTSTWWWTGAKWSWATASTTALWLWWSRSPGWWSTLTRHRRCAEVTTDPFFSDFCSVRLSWKFVARISPAACVYCRVLALLQRSLPPEDLLAEWLWTNVGGVWRGLLVWSLSQSQDLPPWPGWCQGPGLLEAHHEV